MPSSNTPFALQQGNWNGFSFQTLYHLYRRRTERQTEPGATPTLIGPVKSLRPDQD